MAGHVILSHRSYSVVSMCGVILPLTASVIAFTNKAVVTMNERLEGEEGDKNTHSVIVCNYFQNGRVVSFH